MNLKAVLQKLSEINKADPIMNAMLKGNLNWVSADELSEGAVRELGIEGAKSERRRRSARRPSSGRTSSIQRVGGRKARAEHYTRKAILEREKEEERRRVWVRRHPGASESNWLRREAVRKTRKVVERKNRKQKAT